MLLTLPITLFIGLLLYAVIHQIVRIPGRALQKRFVSIGTIAGKAKQQIISAAGNPNSTSALPGGKTCLQWQAPGYHIALRFDGDVCEGVTFEHSA